MPQSQADGRPAVVRPRYPLVFLALLAFSVIAIALGVWWLQADRASSAGTTVVAAAKYSPAADFQLADLSGKSVRLSDLRGKVVLLNFWATWCPPCKAEMPDLEALYRQNGQQHDFVVLAVDVEESQEAAQAFARQYNLTFPVLPDNEGKVSNDRYSVRALPTSFIIDRDGKVRFQWTGQLTRNTMLQNLGKVW